MDYRQKEGDKAFVPPTISDASSENLKASTGAAATARFLS